MSIYEELGLDVETMKNVEEQTVGGSFEVTPSGAYKATIKELGTFTTQKGAGMFKAVIHLTEQDKEITVYQNTVKKNGEPNAIGAATFKYILQATGVAMSELSTETKKLKTYSYDSDVKVVLGVANKPILALIRSVFEEGADFETYNEIEGYAKLAGDEELVEKFEAKIAKNPVLKRKSKAKPAQAAAPATATSSEVDDLL